VNFYDSAIPDGTVQNKRPNSHKLIAGKFNE
jgi:hypothetical protein